MKELAKNYEPISFEDKIFKFWEDNGYFTPKCDKNKESYTIMFPPPNITGKLHMGHAFNASLQDIVIRYKRMQGFDTLWVPGTDHASIATEAKIVEAMKAEGITKDDIGRDGFLKRAFAWNDKYGNTIINQLKKLGSSCDYSRQRFTLDEGCSKAVKEVFVNLYNKGLIYRGERIINWCPNCLTSISDAEVEFDEKQGHFWHIAYPLTDGSGKINLATTRPETMLGDTAIAVNPKDERYKDLIGKTVILPLVNKEIPIIADEYVEMDFGTGVVKITPAHDPNDFEVGLRHNLPIINVMTDKAKMTEDCGKYANLDRYEARKLIVEDLEKQGYLIKITDHVHNVGECYRCHTVIEPRVSLQWFVSMEPLAKPANRAVHEKDIKFIPERFDKIYFSWMDNIKDWCISRQLWWGHRIPAYYCLDCNNVIVSKDEVTICDKCKSSNIKQDEDTLDTWFSSALWPFSTLGWPENTEDLKQFYPTSTLITAYDIIFFWVARMIFSGIEHTGKIPFNTVYIHGLVRDEQGRKMSKSLDNGADPLDIINEYGADALRMMLTSSNSPGNDMRFSEDRLKASRNFANKLWNATRFILMNVGDDINKLDGKTLPNNLMLEDKWILHHLNNVVKDVILNFDRFEFGIAITKLYDFIWDYMCDWYIELVKIRLQDKEQSLDAKKVLLYVMNTILKLLHPVMPFITEEIWQSIPNDCESIMIAKFPEFNENLSFNEQAVEFDSIIDLIKAVRNTRTELNVPPSKKSSLYIETNNTDTFNKGIPFIKRLAFATEIEIKDEFKIEKAAIVVTSKAKIFIPLGDIIDKDKELLRLNKEKTDCQKDIDFLNGKLSNEGFISKAPEKLINIEKEKLENAKDRMIKILESIDELN